MSMTSFDLEQHILKCWHITTDLGEILDDLESGHMEIHVAVEALRAYQKVYEHRFQKCFKSFEDFNQEVWETRKLVVPVEDLGMPKNPTASMGKKGKSKRQKEVDH